MSSVGPRTSYSREEVTASHACDRPHIVRERRFRGGFLEDGTYVSPRSLIRPIAIENWTDQLTARGWPLVDCGRRSRL
jgi:hypothetical protein